MSTADVRSTACTSATSNIVNPSFPDPGNVGEITSTTKYVLGDISLERIHRFSAAVDRTLSPKIRTSMTVSLARYGNQVRGLNVNAPINGVRPDPAFANIIVVTPDGSMETYDVVPDVSVNLAGGIRTADQATWNAKRTVLRFNYRHRRAYNNSDGAFSVPPTGSLDDQWAPASSDTITACAARSSTQALRNLNASVKLGCQQRRRTPHAGTVTRRSIFNDRPVLHRATALSDLAIALGERAYTIDWRSNYERSSRRGAEVAAVPGRAAVRRLTFACRRDLTNRDYCGCVGRVAVFRCDERLDPRQVDRRYS